MITAETRLVTLLGKPVGESLSPRMQNAAFAARGLDWAYVALEVEPEALEAAVQGLVALGFAGANVTQPHKEAVVSLCDELEPTAARAGSVNTLVLRGGRVQGSSTDAAGLACLHLRPHQRAAVVGAGGAAKAAVAFLEEAGAPVRLFSRQGEWPPETAGADVVVNATPVREELLFQPSPEQLIVDFAYRPDGEPTALIAAARAAGCETVVDGLELLAAQGAVSFELWTGIPAPVDVMKAAVGVRPLARPVISDGRAG